jgi:Tol biopolymer transport system component
MKSILFVKTFLVLLFSFSLMSINDGSGIFEGSSDIGNPKLKGSLSYNASTKTYTLTGAGINIWAESDQFHFAWKKETGNFSLATKIAFEGKGVNAHRKVGVMIRESLEGNAKYADVAVHGDGLTSLQYRSETGKQTREIVGPKGADYIILERVGNKVRMKTATGQYPQEVTGEIELDFPGTCYIGLFIGSHEADVVETAYFTNVEYKKFVQDRPQQPTITSILEVLDTRTGNRTVIKEFNTRIEAPNWTPDGKWLIYNSGGKLYKISPNKPSEPELINTDFAVNCNNDHVVSFDGKFIAISNSPIEDRRSRVYTAPINGGIPRLITPIGPSYLHGISPDGKILSYCAERNGNYDIYTIPVEGGRETRLTTAEDLDDGPEYSPDGKYIWFNSVRSGLMQIWRMKADGSEQTQMTFDEMRNSWFPHISPDGKQVIFITYYKGDLKPNEHLGNKNVELRLMPATGGEPKTLVKLFGGQGTINVNSWAPDSKRLAFVSYQLNQ